MFNCRNCKQDLDDSLLCEGSRAKTKDVGKCKPCHSLQNTEIFIAKKIARSPNDYFYCDGCDRSFHKWIKGTGSFYKERQMRSRCPYCDSKDIHLYGGKLQ